MNLIFLFRLIRCSKVLKQFISDIRMYYIQNLRKTSFKAHNTGHLCIRFASKFSVTCQDKRLTNVRI